MKSKRGQKAITKKWTKTPGDRHAVKEAGCWFDAEAGDHVCEFFTRFLKLSKGEWAGQPFALLPWQRNDLLMPLFGWKNPDGTRRFRIAYIEIAKKNGKSGICSGLSLYLATSDNEPGAEIYNAAADREQASIVYNESRNMVKASKLLDKHADVTDSKKRIDFPRSMSFIRVISSEAYTAEGLNIHGLIFDELHTQKNRELWDALRYGGDARRQPLIISITTAGWDTTSICYEQHEYAEKVLAGDILDPAFFPLIYAAKKDDDPTKLSTWKKANPSLGYTIQESGLKQAATEAMASPVKMNAFKRYKLSIWTEQAERWLTGIDWDNCAPSRLKDPIRWRKNALTRKAKCDCMAGLDLGSTSDLTALVLFFEDSSILLPWFWVPEAALEDRKNINRDLYRTWQAQDLLCVTPGNVTDYDKVREDIVEIGTKFKIIELAVDRLFQGAQICTQLMEEGFEIISFGQGYASMAAPCKEFEERVLSGRFNHGRNPILSWMASNASVAQDTAGNMKVIKPKRMSPFKVDGIVSSVMALGRAMQKETGGSVYENSDVKSL